MDAINIEIGFDFYALFCLYLIPILISIPIPKLLLSCIVSLIMLDLHLSSLNKLEITVRNNLLTSQYRNVRP